MAILLNTAVRKGISTRDAVQLSTAPRTYVRLAVGRHFDARTRRYEVQSNLRTYNELLQLLPRHVGEPRQVQLVGNRHRLGRPIAMLSQNQVRLTAAGIVTLEGIRSVQQDDHVRILL
jgi:hypothetical protein